jgi:hypothetical protein
MLLNKKKKGKNATMGKLTNRIYYDFKLNELGFDFMGYLFDDKQELSYHHIQPRHYGGKTTYGNGALLTRDVSHNYIHTIEAYDFKLFIELSQELKAEHKDGITKEHLLAIKQMLEFFEDKFENECTRKGVPIIKEEFVRRRAKL